MSHAPCAGLLENTIPFAQNCGGDRNWKPEHVSDSAQASEARSDAVVISGSPYCERHSNLCKPSGIERDCPAIADFDFERCSRSNRRRQSDEGLFHVSAVIE